jgi:hypothetical protein
VLSGPRDAEGKLETIAALRERFGDCFPERGLAPLIEALERERRELSEGISLDGGAGPTATAALQIEAGRDAIADWTLDYEGFELIEDGLKRSYRRGRNRFADTSEDPSGQMRISAPSGSWSSKGSRSCSTARPRSPRGSTPRSRRSSSPESRATGRSGAERRVP